MKSPQPTSLDYAATAVPGRRPRQPRSGSRFKLALYLILGNVWLLVALALYVGKTFERSSPTCYAVFGVGQWFAPEEYNWLVRIPAAIGVAFVALAAWQACSAGPEQ
jgi:hypothetical protein